MQKNTIHKSHTVRRSYEEKIKKILISVLLLISLVLSLTSCDVLDDFIGKFRLKNGPGTTYEDQHEVIWIESYDELVFILNKMKSAGSETPQIPTFNCEEYGIDIKFKITFRKFDREILQEGQEYYDVKLNSIDISCYLFFEDITPEKVKAFGHYGPSKSCRYYKVEKYKFDDVLSNPNEAEDLNIHNVGDNGGTEVGKYHIYYNEKNQFYIQRSWADFDLTEEQIEILKKTVVVIE